MPGLSSSIFILHFKPDRPLAHCSKTLGIPIPHAIAQHESDSFNAFTAGTDDYAFIQLSSNLCEFYPERELYFVIGHESGHIAAGHMVYHTLVEVLTGAVAPYLGLLGPLLSGTAGVPLLAWSRRSEITADRAGLLCCGDIAIAERALLRLVTGMLDAEWVDVEEYLRRSGDVESFHGWATNLREFFASHPLIPRRIKALRLFANSELYYTLSGKPRPSGKALLTQEELNRQVSEIIKP
jgi:Zn-dependent protease with chaperone function